MFKCEYARHLQRKTMTKVSEDARLGAYFYSLVEQGRAVPTDDQARRIAKALGLAASELFEPAPELDSRRRA